jgi:16S rRNA (guanine966-N2)-methyltransferase
VSNTVRIIGGEWRRRLIRFPDSANLRPTPDRVRETLFNWLGQDLDGQRCLDLFAGSGALGFEAASRGAAQVVMVEQAPKVLAALQDNARELHAENVQIVRADAIKFLSLAAAKVPAPEQRFDVIFLDPPFRQGWLERLQPLLPALLNDDGALYIEAEQPLSALGDWRTVREGKAGQVHYHLLRRQEQASGQ